MSRTRYRFDEASQSMVEVSSVYMGEGYSAGGRVSEGEIYDGARTLDGVDISSRKKRREYMKATNTTDPSDYKRHWVDTKEKIEAYRAGARDKDRREALGRAAYEVEKGSRR